ncbi:MAG: ribbon-helix-helix protein, CopG family [Sphingobium sp.]
MSKSKKTKEEGGRKNTSLRLSGKMLKALKIRAIEEDTSVQKIIEALIEAYLERPGKPEG